MNEDKKIFCTQCGGENNANAKFCSNCGAKLEQPASSIPEEDTTSSNVYQNGIFSGEDTSSPYEKITDAEEVKPEGMPVQEEIKINYGYSQNDNGFNENPVYSTSTQYYSGEDAAAKPTGGYIGVSIASLVCGIIALICCCATQFSIVLSIAAIVLGIFAIVKKYDGMGMAIAGIAVAVVAIVMSIIMVIIVATGSVSSSLWEEFANYANEFNH